MKAQSVYLGILYFPKPARELHVHFTHLPIFERGVVMREQRPVYACEAVFLAPAYHLADRVPTEPIALSRASTASIQRICVLVSYLGRLQLLWEKMGNLTEGYCLGHISIRRTIGSLSIPLRIVAGLPSERSSHLFKASELLSFMPILNNASSATIVRGLDMVLVFPVLGSWIDIFTFSLKWASRYPFIPLAIKFTSFTFLPEFGLRILNFLLSIFPFSTVWEFGIFFSLSLFILSSISERDFDILYIITRLLNFLLTFVPRNE